MKSTVLFVVLAAAALGCESASTSDSVPNMVVAPIEGGQGSSSYAATGAFVGAGTVFCTGTLVSPTKVLTAAHCFNQVSSSQLTTASFVIGTNPMSPGTSVPLAQKATHPDFYGDLGVNDIAAITLSAPIDDVLPAQLSEDSSGLVGETITLVGYGKTASPQDQPGIRRETQVPVIHVDQHKIRYDFQGTGACHGDSGGPAFFSSASGAAQVGVTSGGAESGDCTDDGLYTRVNVHADWLAQQGVEPRTSAISCDADGICDGACYSDPDCKGIMGGAVTTPESPDPAEEPVEDPQDPATGATPPPPGYYVCSYVNREIEGDDCTYTDYYTGDYCGTYRMQCTPWGCFCPF